MLNPTPGCHKLAVTFAIPTGISKAITVVTESLKRRRDGFEASVRVSGEPGNVLAVVHAVLSVVEVHAVPGAWRVHVAPVALRVLVVVVDGEQ